MIVSLPPCVNGTCVYSCNDDSCKKAVEVKARIIAAGDAVYEPTYPHTESESIAAAREALTIAKERLEDRTRPERVIINQLLVSLSPESEANSVRVKVVGHHRHVARRCRRRPTVRPGGQEP